MTAWPCRRNSSGDMWRDGVSGKVVLREKQVVLRFRLAQRRNDKSTHLVGLPTGHLPLGELAVVDAREVLHADAAVFAVGAEDGVEVFEHWLVLRVSLHRRVGGGEKAAFEFGVSEVLTHGKNTCLKWGGREEVADVVGCVFVAHLLVIGAVGEQEFFVGAQERGG